MNLSKEKKGVKSFWGREACGTHFVKEFHDDIDFYEKYREFRYHVSWHIPELVPFEDAKGKKVLEIGCGNGADGAKFAEEGAEYTGVDLTNTAINATKKHFDTLGLEGTFQTEDAENLSFNDGTFDIVYSWGVLHHTPDPQNAIDEVYRVLKKGGRSIIMLYHKHSYNYYVRIMTYMRLRVIWEKIKRFGKWNQDKENLDDLLNEEHSLYGWHYLNFLKEGWKYLKPSNFVHHCADGPECPYAYVYTKNDVHKLFSKFKSVETRVAHFPMKKYNSTKWVPDSIERFIAFRVGWHLIIYADK